MSRACSPAGKSSCRAAGAGAPPSCCAVAGPPAVTTLLPASGWTTIQGVRNNCIQPSTCGGRVLLSTRSAGAVGAIPPQESLRPLYRRGEATLESSRNEPGPAHRRCKQEQAPVPPAESLRFSHRAGRNPSLPVWPPHAGDQLEFLNDG